ncbi:phosphopantetheine-binding protein [Streptomyces sp. AK02-04a]|uniref:phosphopantetheine-binding protein n=1 Tax=Streptomyces sp. AK02-04a TaxID=3028649 RepID=UPI0029A9F4D5|nr:phosphopantetheine-binding protein [Streptomyces sp. AK02-04a]MDX3763526.1 phosphopantetheine-binding protein [Streptomyces sp. AK02-04a]
MSSAKHTVSANDEIYQLLREALLTLLTDLDPAVVTPHASLADLGANSYDRFDILAQVQERLGVAPPAADAATAPDLAALAAAFHAARTRSTAGDEGD